MKTLNCIIVTGVNKGYFHNNKKEVTEKEMGTLWQEIALEQFNKTSLYISAVVQKSTTVYNTEWGCPKGGEDTFNISITANPEFIEDLDKWKQVVIDCAKELKKILKQTTMTIEFKEADLIYLKENK